MAKNNITLEKLMSEVSDQNKTYFIGALNGYLFIGNIKQFQTDFRKISEECQQRIIDSKKNINKKISEINKLIDKENETAEGKYIRKIDNLMNLVARSLYERNVIETYEKLSTAPDDGIAVIISGTESGKYWFKDEYDHYKHKKGEN